MRRLQIVPVLFLCISCSSPTLTDRLATGTWVDLTYPFDSTTIYWPTAQPFHLTVVSARRMPGGWYYAANNFTAAEHGGTHLDAPVHFVEKKRSADQIPLSQLLAPAVVIDVSHQADSSADYRVHQSDITAWEAAHGDIPPGTIVLFRTGWGKRWPDRMRYLGTTKIGTAGGAEPHFPGLHLAGGRAPARGRPRAGGVDTARPRS